VAITRARARTNSGASNGRRWIGRAELSGCQLAR
jgi:hypothetical protein